MLPRPEVDPVRLLRLLHPDGLVGGVDFAASLPVDPGSLDPDQRRRVFFETRREATRTCLCKLLAAAGIAADDVPSAPEGFRLWPAGRVGSVSHKRTVVVAAIAEAQTHRGLGIDLEFADSADLSSVPGLIAVGEFPRAGLSTSEALHLAFSAKEAVFKAVFPTTRAAMSFDEVQLAWREGPSLTAEARASGIDLEVAAAVSVPWIVTAAVWRR